MLGNKSELFGSRKYHPSPQLLNDGCRASEMNPSIPQPPLADGKPIYSEIKFILGFATRRLPPTSWLCTQGISDRQCVTMTNMNPWQWLSNK